MLTKVSSSSVEKTIVEVLDKYRGISKRILMEFDPDGKEVFLEVSVPTTVFKRVESVQFSD